jgi:hypothetical protein
METIYQYSGHSGVLHTSDQTLLGFSTELSRPEQVQFCGIIREPLTFRDAMLALRGIVITDLRKQVKDRSEYLVWVKKELDRQVWDIIGGGKTIQPELLESHEKLSTQQTSIMEKIRYHLKDFNKYVSEFKRFLYRREMARMRFYDPVISVHPDSVTFEAFSLDETTYGAISMKMEQFDVENDIQYGTTNIDFSNKLAVEMERVRSYHPMSIRVQPGGFLVDLDIHPPHLEKKIDLPESWVRGFLQVSSAAGLPADEFILKPVDMYNILVTLRRRRAHQSPRSLRFKLVPDKPIEMIFEPWNYILESSTIYKGNTETEIRLWGRRRLLLLEKLLPIAKEFRVRLLGSGFPSFFIVDLQGITFILGLSGWTSNDWSSGAVFDALAGFIGAKLNTHLRAYIRAARHANNAKLMSSFPELEERELQQAIGALYRRGLSFYDLSADLIRYRELFPFPIPEHLTEPSEREKEATKLIPTLEGIEIQSTVDEKIGRAVVPGRGQKATRYPVLTLGEAGQITKASCDCRFYKSNKLRKGPCEHLLALQIYMLEKDTTEGTK